MRCTTSFDISLELQMCTLGQAKRQEDAAGKWERENRRCPRAVRCPKAGRENFPLP